MELSKENQSKILKEALVDFELKEKRKIICFKNKKQHKSFLYKIKLKFRKQEFDNHSETPDLCWLKLQIIFEKDLAGAIDFNFSNKYLTSNYFLNNLKSILNLRIDFSEYYSGSKSSQEYLEEILREKIEKKFKDYKNFRVH